MAVGRLGAASIPLCAPPGPGPVVIMLLSIDVQTVTLCVAGVECGSLAAIGEKLDVMTGADAEIGMPPPLPATAVPWTAAGHGHARRGRSSGGCWQI